MHKKKLNPAKILPQTCRIDNLCTLRKIGREFFTEVFMTSTNRFKKIGAMLMAVLFGAAFVLPVLVACSGDGSGNNLHTFNEYIAQSPTTWNTHNGTTDADTYIQGYTEIGLYDFTLSDDRSTYAFIDEMATGDPVNVTSEYVDRFGITQADADNTSLGKAWEITLNPDATWENGEAITAEDYVWSMERVLSPDMKNSAAATYITGDYEIYNANNYYSYGSTEEYFKITAGTQYTDEELEQMVADGVLYFSFDTPIFDTEGSFTISEHHAIESQQKFYLNGDGEDVYDLLYSAYADDANEFGYIQITEENFEDFQTNFSVLSASALGALIPEWYDLLSVLRAASPVFTKITAETEYTDDALEQMVADGTLYFSFDTPIFDTEGSFTISEHHAIESQQRFYLNSDGEDVYDLLYNAYADDANEFGYIQITEENFEDFQTNFSVLSASALGALIPHWYNLLSVISYTSVEETPFSNVGIFATDNNTKFVIVFANALSQWDVKYLLTDNWIVYRPYYEDGYEQQGSLTVTTYGTTSGQYMGYGPYKMTGYQTNSQITFERNENWYGYKEGATNYHPGQFQTDRIVCRIISDQNTALLEFEAGNLDSVRLNANNMDPYRFSDYLLTRTASNTWSITFNSDAEALASIESDGNGNRRILSVDDFRRALSLSIDRSYIGTNILAGSAAAYSFINNNYYYDMENDPESIYRNSEQAMEGIVRLYNISYGPGQTYETLQEAYAAVSGYDEDAAREAFESAYDYAVANGLYTDGENIRINIYNNALNTQITALGTYLQRAFNAAAERTPFEGKITVEIRRRETGRYDEIAQGQIEAIYYSFSGDFNDPNGMLANFTDPDVQTPLDCGSDPETESFAITYDFDGDGTEETITKTYTEWQRSITASGEYYGASQEVKLTIMAEIEYRLLSGFRTLPLVVGTDLTLRSMKVEYATNTSNIFAMYGGVRLMTYHYTDGEWAEFIRDTGNLVYE